MSHEYNMTHVILSRGSVFKYHNNWSILLSLLGKYSIEIRILHFNSYPWDNLGRPDRLEEVN